jgi:hypothetical protein
VRSLCIASCLAALLVADAGMNAQSGELRSIAEQSRFSETSRYADVRAFIDLLAARTPRVRVETFGTSEERRPLPLLVLGNPPATPTQQRLPVVLVMANIHAGEVEGKEALLHLARRLTIGDLQPLLPSAVWLFAPIYNADGNERVSLENRIEQNGPISGVGIRENANGLDLNRDFVKLESAEARALVALMNRWDPDVVVDLHTTNGSYHGYHLTYAPGLNPNTDERITAFARERLLPAVRQAMASRHAFRVYDYGNFAHADALEAEVASFDASDGRRKAWRTFDGRPRFGTNYVGLRNRIAILSEAYSYLDFERRVKVTEAFVEEIMRFVSANGSTVRSLTTRADTDWTRRQATTEQAIAIDLKPMPSPVDVLVGAIETKLNPVSGKRMRAMVENSATPNRMTVYNRFVATTTRRVPREYIVRASLNGLLNSVEGLLRTHGIIVERINGPSRRMVDAFVVDEVTHARQPFQGHRETTVTGQFERRDEEIPAESLIVRSDQPRGRLAFYLLEPESNDSLTTWNVFDAELAAGKPHPVLKVF